jgi:hypothetical protein
MKALRVSTNLFSLNYRRHLSAATPTVGETAIPNEANQKRPPKKLKHRRPIVQEQRKRNADLLEKAAKSNLPWRVVGAT